MTKKVAGYVRVSTEQQKEDKAHERQRELIEDWIKNHFSDEKADLEIFQDIAISGQSQERERYKDLMDSLEQYDAIVIRELSRFGRSVKQLTEDIDRLEEADVDLISLKENIDTSTAQGELLFNIMASINQFKSDLAKERAIKEAQRRKEKGKQVGRPPKIKEDEAEELVEMREEKDLSWTSLGKLFDVSRTTAKRTYEREKD